MLWQPSALKELAPDKAAAEDNMLALKDTVREMKQSLTAVLMKLLSYKLRLKLQQLTWPSKRINVKI